MKEFLKRKNIIFSAKRYGIDALSAMAQGLFASLLIGTIISTLGEQLGIDILVTVGNYAKGATGAAMANFYRLRTAVSAFGAVFPGSSRYGGQRAWRCRRPAGSVDCNNFCSRGR